MKYPLESYRILDFGTAWAGPQVGQILADMGAEVIKVESRRKLDGARLGRPIVGDDIAGGDKGKWPDMQPVFHGLNRNKLSITVDAKHPEGLKIIRQLVKVSDVVSDNFSYGTMAKLSLDHNSLVSIKPDIISISLTACGESGSLKNAILYAPSIISLGGLESLIGYHGENTPMQVMAAYGDANASIHGAFAVITALWHREKTGKGQHIELSESDAVTSLLGEALMEYAMNGHSMGLQGNYHPTMSPHGVYPCKGEDNWIALAVDSEDDWRNFCQAVGRQDWIINTKFATRESRLNNRQELDKLIAIETTNYTTYDLTEILQKNRIAATPVLNIEGQYTDCHYKQRKTYVEVEHPLVGTELLTNVPFRLSKTPGDIRRPAPSLGEHNDYILGHLLHLPPTEIEELAREKVIY